VKGKMFYLFLYMNTVDTFCSDLW